MERPRGLGWGTGHGFLRSPALSGELLWTRLGAKMEGLRDGAADFMGKEGVSLQEPSPGCPPLAWFLGWCVGAWGWECGLDRKFLCCPEIFEPVIGAVTAGGRCGREFKRNQPKALSALSAASWEKPRAAETCPDSQKEPAFGCNVMQMAGPVPCGVWRLLRCLHTGPQSQPSPDLWMGEEVCVPPAMFVQS